ncbi:MAG: HEAT repeat domain-containing protein [Myxococcales bacterium]|nr:HEAT repeat domain-containing protein [Myxococcales bacterium]
MFETLDSIPWEDLTHAYGEASDVPALLRDLASTDEKVCTHALEALYANIFHQGTRYQATPYAIPFLYELLDSPQTHNKTFLVRYLVHLALGYDEAYLPQGVEPRSFREDLLFEESSMTPEDREECADFGVGPRVLINCYDAVLRGVSALIRLTQQEDEDVRHAAVFALAWFPEAAKESVFAIRRALSYFQGDDARADAILALGLLQRTSKDPVELRDLQGYLDARYPLSTRGAAAIALSHKHLDERCLSTLLETVAASETLGETHFTYFNGGYLGGYAASVLQEHAEELRDRIVPIFSEALRGVTRMASLGLTQTLLSCALRKHDRPISTLPLNELDAIEILALQAIADHGAWKVGEATFGNYSMLMRDSGLPSSCEDLKDYLLHGPKEEA